MTGFYQWLARTRFLRPVYHLGISASMAKLYKENLWARENKNIVRALEMDYAVNSIQQLFKVRN